MTTADPPKPEPNAPPPNLPAKPGPKAMKPKAKAKTGNAGKRGKPRKAKPATTKGKSGKARIVKVGPARLAKRKGPAPEVWDVVSSPMPTLQIETAIRPIVAVRSKAKAGRIVLVGLMVVALAVLGVATQVTSQGNSGTIKVHDGVNTNPPTRNEPHVTGAAFVEGFNMAEDSGGLFFFSWPPTGNGELVLESTWAADGGEPAFHFLAGPFDLPCGHYRVGASNGPAEPEDFPGGMKKKTFWVDCPAPEPEPECGEPGALACPPCGTTDTPPCPTCGTTDTPPCPCGTEGQPPCECGTEGQPPCPVPEPEPELMCPADLVAVGNADGSVTLTWTPAPGSDGTNVYRADGDGDFDYVTTVAADVGTYVDETTVAGEGYAYMVTGLFGDEESQDCPVVEVTAIPDLPTVLGAGLAMGGGLLAFALLGRRKV